MSRGGPPVRMNSIWPEMPFMRGPEGAQRLREWLPQLRQIRAQAANRRARVLAHPWAAKRLCDILGLSSAEHWNGYVPPTTDQEGQANTSETRRALVELLREVDQFDQGASEPQA